MTAYVSVSNRFNPSPSIIHTDASNRVQLSSNHLW